MPALASLAEFRQAVAHFQVGELEVAVEPAARAEAERSWRSPGTCCSARSMGSWRIR